MKKILMIALTLLPAGLCAMGEPKGFVPNNINDVRKQMEDARQKALQEMQRQQMMASSKKK
jgi:hypothetical protein